MRLTNACAGRWRTDASRERQEGTLMRSTGCNPTPSCVDVRYRASHRVAAASTMTLRARVPAAGPRSGAQGKAKRSGRGRRPTKQSRPHRDSLLVPGLPRRPAQSAGRLAMTEDRSARPLAGSSGTAPHPPSLRAMVPAAGPRSGAQGKAKRSGRCRRPTKQSPVAPSEKRWGLRGRGDCLGPSGLATTEARSARPLAGSSGTAPHPPSLRAVVPAAGPRSGAQAKAKRSGRGHRPTKQSPVAPSEHQWRVRWRGNCPGAATPQAARSPGVEPRPA